MTLFPAKLLPPLLLRILLGLIWLTLVSREGLAQKSFSINELEARIEVVVVGRFAHGNRTFSVKREGRAD